MLKITEIIVAKIKTFGQDVGILTKFAKEKNEANIQPFWPNEFGVLNDENRQCEKYLVYGISIMRVIWKYRKNNNCGSVSL